MIHVFGTSHVSQQSLELVEDKIEEIDPEVVALELDHLRLSSLLNDEQRSKGAPVFIRLIQYFQRSVGEKTGVMPGEEMLLAYRTAEKKGTDVALIDQDIRITISKLKQIRLREKIKVGAQLLVGMVLPGGFDITSEIPEEDLIDDLLAEMRFKFPEMYTVLVEQRNQHMIESLKKLEEDTEGDIVALVGAAHTKAVQSEFDE